MLGFGCARAPSVRPPLVPPVDHGITPTVLARDAGRPMPRDAPATRLPPPPFDDAPIVSQPTPEQSAFVDTYNHVGRPRIAVLIDRSADGADQPSSKSFYDE